MSNMMATTDLAIRRLSAKAGLSQNTLLKYVSKYDLEMGTLSEALEIILEYGASMPAILKMHVHSGLTMIEVQSLYEIRSALGDNVRKQYDVSLKMLEHLHRRFPDSIDLGDEESVAGLVREIHETFDYRRTSLKKFLQFADLSENEEIGDPHYLLAMCGQ